MWDFILLIILMFGAAYFLLNTVEIYEYICDKTLNGYKKTSGFELDLPI